MTKKTKGNAPAFQRRVLLRMRGKSQKANEFAHALRDARAKSGLRQTDLAERIGVGRWMVYGWEQGDIHDYVELKKLFSIFPDLEALAPSAEEIETDLNARLEAKPAPAPIEPKEPLPKAVIGLNGASPTPAMILRLIARAASTEDVRALLQMAYGLGYTVEALTRL